MTDTDDALPPPEIDDVVEAIIAACELAEVWLTDGDPAPVTDRLRLHAALKDAGGNFGRLNRVRQIVEERTAPDIAGAEEDVLVDGRWWRHSTDHRRRKPDRDAMQSFISGRALAPIFDIDTGAKRDPSPAEVVARMFRVCEVATGRTKVLRDLDMDLDEFYDEVVDVDTIEEVK